jgi:hypothetical protein
MMAIDITVMVNTARIHESAMVHARLKAIIEGNAVMKRDGPTWWQHCKGVFWALIFNLILCFGVSAQTPTPTFQDLDKPPDTVRANRTIDVMGRPREVIWRKGDKVRYCADYRDPNFLALPPKRYCNPDF